MIYRKFYFLSYIILFSTNTLFAICYTCRKPLKVALQNSVHKIHIERKEGEQFIENKLHVT